MTSPSFCFVPNAQWPLLGSLSDKPDSNNCGWNDAFYNRLSAKDIVNYDKMISYQIWYLCVYPCLCSCLCL